MAGPLHLHPHSKYLVCGAFHLPAVLMHCTPALKDGRAAVSRAVRPHVVSLVTRCPERAQFASRATNRLAHWWCGCLLRPMLSWPRQN